jgi:hypothetical protein
VLALQLKYPRFGGEEEGVVFGDHVGETGEVLKEGAEKREDVALGVED